DSRVNTTIGPADHRSVIDIEDRMIGGIMRDGDMMPGAIEQARIDVVDIAGHGGVVFHLRSIGIGPGGVIREAGLIGVAAGEPYGVAIATGLRAGLHPEADGQGLAPVGWYRLIDRASGAVIDV